jgi:hexosaminidase
VVLSDIIKYSFLVVILFVSTLAHNGCSQKKEQFVNVIPEPAKVQFSEGVFIAIDKIFIVSEWNSLEVNKAINFFADKLENIKGLKIIITDSFPENTSPLIIIKHDKSLKKEGYKLSVLKNKIIINAAKPNGVFYAFQTILQLLPPEVFSNTEKENLTFTLPCVTIDDAPKYKWRGFMLDVSRHFFSKEFIYKVLDYLAMHKINVFHWHLVDDQGWRIEINKYPKLTQIGAWRADRENQPWNTVRESQKKGEKATYGGYYTQEDIKKIIKYASDRFITIVPEIEMPGHCSSALAAYPEYSCSGKPITVPVGSLWGKRRVYCAGNNNTYEFLDNILTEVAALFPGRYIHIGGDEVKKTPWKKCPKCRKRIKDEGLNNVEELQAYFVNRIEKSILSKNKRLIGWDEVLEGGLSPTATVMSWRGVTGGIKAARKGHDVVLSPNNYCYFDSYQGDPEYEPAANNHLIKIKKVYSFDPSLKESLTVKERKHILGIQANLWTEYISTQSQAEYMMFPRLAAFSEVAWSEIKKRNWKNFSERLEKQLKRYDAMEINYSKSVYNVSATFKVDKKAHNLIVTLANEIGNTEIRYTTDNTEPTFESKQYIEPFHVNKILTIKAATFRGNKKISQTSNLNVLANKATGLAVKIKHPYDERYPGAKEYALTDGVRGTINFTNGEWQGYFGVDLNAEINLLKEQEISKVEISFLKCVSAGIFYPKEIEILVSKNGINYKKIASQKIKNSTKEEKIAIKKFENFFKPINTKFVKIIAKTIGKCPKGHKYEGVNAFIFVDEIIVE